MMTDKISLSMANSETLRETEVNQAIVAGIHNYFEQCRQRVPIFIKQYYCYPGCWQTNKQALGLDLLRSPINLIWAPIYLICIGVAFILVRCGFKPAKRFAEKLPGGMTTRVQKTINQAIERELIDRASLQTCIHRQLDNLASTHALNPKQSNAWHNGLDGIINTALNQLMLTRTASADISNTLFTTAAGALTFKKFTPGGIGLGILIAGIWANERAKQQFFLGQTAGHWFYTLFPSEADIADIGIAIGLIMIILSVVASLSGLITDPIQSVLGIHKRRMLAMINTMEQDLINQTQNGFKPVDPYIARILDLFDTVKAQIGMY